MITSYSTLLPIDSEQADAVAIGMLSNQFR